MRIRRIVLLAFAAALCAATAGAATYRGRLVDGKWFQGRIVNNTFGAYDTYVKFSGDRVLYGSPSGASHFLGTLEEEEIADPRDIQVYDARRGIWWSVTVYNLRP
jgi:hypothetical protein